jgi:primosomal protein N' (replication factor Y) (superfamily II helicase)
MNEQLPSYAILILPVPVDRMFTYFIPEELRWQVESGKRVIVQFGARKYFTAMVYEMAESVPEGITPKSIEMVLDSEPVISPIHLRFWKWLSEYYLCNPGDVMKTALPAGLRIESETRIELNSGFTEDMLEQLQQHEQMIAMALKEQESMTMADIQKVLGIKHVQHLIRNLLNSGVAKSFEEYSERFVPKKEILIQLSDELASDEEKLLELSNKLSKKAPKQSDALILFLHETTVAAQLSEIPKHTLTKRCSPQALQSLIKKGVFVESEKIVSRFGIGETTATGIDFTLTELQEKALHDITESLKTNQVHLFHGITSSGKTEIYIRLMQQELEAGRQVLYLLPEIALTVQIIERLRSVFGHAVGVYHHRFNYNEKIELWNSVASDSIEGTKFKIIIGTRSALFLPFNNLGLIIIDEEHDGSYKQTDLSPRYHARDSAIVLAGFLRAKVLLGTASPSVESYYNAVHGRYGLNELNVRYGDMPLPHVKIVDMSKDGKLRQGVWYVSSVLKEAIGNALEKKKQVILFQNRRGYVPIIQCTQCSWIPGCRNCDVTLTYHKKVNLTKCHLCGYSDVIPERCPVCGNTHIRFMGFGTEKVEEEIKTLFPTAVVARMDTDTTRGKYAHQTIISAFEKGETDILVGTQMVSKGLDFERVSLVGILNSDNLMHFPDFRAFERGFQILTQIMGRAGRHEENGLVILQTRKPKHPVVQAAINGDYIAFYNEQIKERQMFRYPPFYRLILLSVQHKNKAKADIASSELKKRILSIEGLILLGPEEPVYGRIKQYYIRNILIKIPRTQKHAMARVQIRSKVSLFLAEKEQSGIRIVSDADPA